MAGNTDAFLSHYGVAGMKWGRRKSRATVTSATRRHKSQTETKTVNAHQLRPISKDAKNAESFAKVAKTQGTQALSNQQLQALVNRQNLEQQYSKLNPKQISQGQKIVQQVLPGLAKTGIAAYKSMQPQQPKPEASQALQIYSAPTGKQVAGKIMAEVGKQVVSQYGAQIGMAIVKSLL